MKNFNDRIVCVTGASSGIGLGCARAFSRAGARLLVLARRLDRLEALSDVLRADGASDVHIVGLDVRDRDATARVFEELPEQWRAIEILVNNAGLSRGLDPIQSGSIDDWDEMIDTN